MSMIIRNKLYISGEVEEIASLINIQYSLQLKHAGGIQSPIETIKNHMTPVLLL